MSYHCQSPSSIDISQLDPSVAVVNNTLCFVVGNNNFSMTVYSLSQAEDVSTSDESIGCVWVVADNTAFLRMITQKL